MWGNEKVKIGTTFPPAFFLFLQLQIHAMLINCVTLCHVSLSSNISWSLFKLKSIELVMSSKHLILCHPLLLFSIFPRVFSNESALRIWWPKYWSVRCSSSPTNKYSGLFPLGFTGWISLQSEGLSRIFTNTTAQKYQFFRA